MIGGAPHIPIRRREVPDGSVTPLDTPFIRKIHEEHAKAMAAQQKPYPTHHTDREGGKWTQILFGSVKFSDGSIYDGITKSWRQESVDPIAQWERNKAADPLASSGMIQAGEHLVREVKQLRQRILDLEMERRSDRAAKVPAEDYLRRQNTIDDDDRDF